jgi:hypothetical protein
MPQDAGGDGADWQSCLMILGTRDVRQEESLNVAGAPFRRSAFATNKIEIVLKLHQQDAFAFEYAARI